MQFPPKLFREQSCLEHIPLIRSGFIVAVHQNPRPGAVKSLTGKLSDYNSSFRLYDFFEVLMICPQERSATGGKYEHVFTFKILTWTNL